MLKKPNAKVLKPALVFVFLMGIVSMFSDMTHEGARSIMGAYLYLAGASAATIGFVTGLGELVGYSFRLVAGFLTDRKKNYWTMTLIGYAINMAAIPALALIPKNGWIFACALIVLERMGKAIRYPAKNTLVSFAATELGHGKSFAIQEFLDQLGAFLGPVILFVVLLLKKGSDTFSAYSLGFAILGIPAALTLVSLLFAKKKFPHPENFDKTISRGGKLRLQPSFIFYMVAISMLALGFADFPLITMHIARESLVPADTLPLLYAGAMLADAFAALLFGWLYDRFGIRVLMVSSVISSLFSIFIFAFHSLPAAILGIILWGVGMGAQESILKSAVSSLVSKDNRSTGFGVFETAFGIFWFLGSWLMGALYDAAPVWLVVFSVSAQLAAIPFFYMTWRRAKGETAQIGK
ncbi:MAG TPA: MFS transporter [Clostridia bacterium]